MTRLLAPRGRRATLLALTAATLALAGVGTTDRAAASECQNLPDATPRWLEFADSSVDFRSQLFARPGVIMATDGTAKTNQPFRDVGAATIFWEMHIEKLVGTPSSPVSPSQMAANVVVEMNKAIAATSCSHPLVALNELLNPGSGSFKGAEATYRQDVLALMQGLQANGAHPYLLVPYGVSTQSAAAQFWRQAAQYGDLVAEVYFNANTVYRAGPILGSRGLRLGMRAPIAAFEASGVPASKLGVMVGFQSMLGANGREGLQPTSAWLDYVKLNALAARQVASDSKLSTIWSWGWGTFNTPGSADSDKPLAACVYLWTHDHGLCPNALDVAGPNFDASVDEGQIQLAAGVQCAWSNGQIGERDLARLQRANGSPTRALTALLERAVLATPTTISAAQVQAAERQIIVTTFHRNGNAYRQALRKSKLSRASARAIIADLLARKALGKNFKAAVAAKQQAALQTMICQRDALPTPVDVNLGTTFPYLRLAAARAPHAAH